MNFRNLKNFSRLFKSNNQFRALRNISERKPAPELPTSRGNSSKISGFGKFLFFIPVTTFALGTWQVKRKLWKENLIKEMEQKLNMEPEPLPDNLEDLNSMEYRNVTLRGQFLHGREIYMGPRSLNVPQNEQKGGGGVFSTKATTGYHVVTPFKIEGREETILVNRGWVPRNKMNPSARQNGQIDGVVEIQGIVRLNEIRPQFTPDHKGGLFFYRDLDKMCALTQSDPYFVDMKYDPSLPADSPIGSQTRVALRNEHLQYIITWYSLSGITGYLWWKQIVKKVVF